MTEKMEVFFWIFDCGQVFLGGGLIFLGGGEWGWGRYSKQSEDSWKCARSYCSSMKNVQPNKVRHSMLFGIF